MKHFFIGGAVWRRPLGVPGGVLCHPEKSFNLLICLFLLSISGLFISCQTPVSPSNVLYNPDPIEFESVWQYCKAWSIYQDSSIYDSVNNPRIPKNPFAFSNPGDILEAINDTLAGVGNPYHFDPIPYYTTYDLEDGYDTIPNWGAASMSPAALVADASGAYYDSTVTIDSITDSTGLLTIYTFEADSDGQVYSDFQYCLPVLQGFKNIIIDLRGNGGGYIDEAQNILSAMVPINTHYIRARQRDQNAAGKYITDPWTDWVITQIPSGSQHLSGKHYAVLFNDSTASAAELTTAGLYEGQLKEWGTGTTGAHLLGSRSFGKGIGQVVLERRKACYASSTGVEFFLDTNGDTIKVPYTANNFLDLKITFLQLQGYSSRIGLYHRVGIAPDVVGADVKSQVDAIAFSDTGFWRPVFYGLKLMEPGVDLNAVVNDSGIAPKRLASALPKRATKKRRSVAQVVEKVVQTDKILPMK